MPVLADLGRVDVGVDDLGARCERVEVAGDPVVEAGAEADDQVALLQRRDRRDGAVHAGHAEVLRVAVRERPAGHQRGDDGHPGELGQRAQLGGGAGADRAAADVEHRAARLQHQPGRLADLLGVRPGDGSVAGQVQLGRPLERRHAPAAPTWRRPRRTGPGRPVEAMWKASAIRRGISAGVGDQEVVLGDRHRDAADVGLLEGIGADRGGADLAGDGDHRHRVHVGVGDRRHQVGRTRARRWPCRHRPGRWRRRSPGPRGRRPARGAPGCAGSWSPSAGRRPGGSRRPGCRRCARRPPPPTT